MQKHFIIAGVLGVALTILSFGVGVWFGWVAFAALNWLEVFAVATSYACTYLCVVESRWNYPIGIITTFAYSILFFQWGLPAVGVFNLYLVGSLIYGWFRWGPDENSRPVTSITIGDIVPYSALGITIAVLMYGVLVYFGAPIVYLDIAVAAISGVAQFLLDNKRLQTWHVWAIVNVFSIWLYFNQGLYLVAFQYVFFLANTMYGYYMWKKSMQQSMVMTV